MHLNRVIKARDLDVIYVCGPGHGGPAMVANVYLEGTYSEYYSQISQNEAGMQRLFKQFSFPGGIPSHVAAETPGSINEGGELGYSLSHAYGAAFDNPDLIVACVIGDGEAETGALAASWQSNKFLNPAIDGAVLPILHLNGYKIANPTVLARIDREELADYLRGCGYTPYFVEGDDPGRMHQLMAATLDRALDEIKEFQRRARVDGIVERPAWPVIVLVTPKGWTGPKIVDGLQTEGTFRSHQVPFSDMTDEHVGCSRNGCGATSPRSSSTRAAPSAPSWPSWRRGHPAHGRQPARQRRSPVARPGAARLPRLRRGCPRARARDRRVDQGHGRVPGRDHALNLDTENFRVFGPDETTSNRLDAVLDVTPRTWNAAIVPGDDRLSPTGRVMEILSEHTIQGWIEGYLLTGRHGFFSCYEAFIHIISSMFNQHAKWLDVCAGDPLAAPDRLAQLPAHLPRVAAGPQRLLPPGPGLHRPRAHQEGVGHPGLSASRRQHACCASPTPACAAGISST